MLKARKVGGRYGSFFLQNGGKLGKGPLEG